MIFGQLMNPYSIEQIRALEEKVNSYETWVFLLVFFVAVLALIVVMQRLTLVKLKSNLGGNVKFYQKKVKERPSSKKQESNIADISTITQTLPVTAVNTSSHTIKTKDLPDPGLIFKYSIHGDPAEKIITIGQHEGTIKTHSTEVVDHHLTIMIRAVNTSKDQDIYNLPDQIKEKYVLDFRREGKVLIVFPNTTEVREMNARERVLIQAEADPAGDTNLDGIEPKQPIRFRIGDRLTQDGKFRNGYFEFHLYTKDVEARTKSGIAIIEKQFFLRLFKIYPGYDTANQTSDGLFPMVDPFAKA